ncbi:MAG: GNAT family N-acetyltransferase [Breznakibacter sp.]
MKIFIETERLILREVECADENDLFEMDSDPEVHLYIEKKPIGSIDQIRDVIGTLQKQYKENGIARWAVVDKKTKECLGWSGLKYFKVSLNNRRNFYELGYRFKKKHWGKGYATESSIAILDYGFKNLDIDAVYAIANPNNTRSKKVLNKLGFEHIEVFNHGGDMTDWFELKKSNWMDKSRTTGDG